VPSPVTILVSVAVLFGSALLAFALYQGFKTKANKGFNILLSCILGIAAMSASVAIGAMTSEEELRNGSDRAAYLNIQDAYFTARERAGNHLRQAVSQHFDRICTFNGYVTEGEWLRSDLHPCIERGNVRIWRLEEDNGSRIHYSVGRVNADGTVTTAIDYWPKGSENIFADPYKGDFKADTAVIAPMADLLAAQFPVPTETGAAK
jgi:hypothetical protein